jgi:plastocyanin
LRKPLAAVLVLAAVAGAIVVPALAATHTVKVADNFFVKRGKPPTITVAKGTTVTWIWRGKSLHNVVVASGPAKFHSSLKTKGSFSRRLTRAGRYRIVCAVHSEMKMTVVVR